MSYRDDAKERAYSLAYRKFLFWNELKERYNDYLNRFNIIINSGLERDFELAFYREMLDLYYIEMHKIDQDRTLRFIGSTTQPLI